MTQTHLSEVRFLLKHSSIYGIGSLLGKAVGFLMLPLYTRFLDPKDYGILELVEATNGMLGLVASIGVVMAMSRFYFDFDAQEDRNSVVSTIALLVVVSAILLVVIFVPMAENLSVLLFDVNDHARIFMFGFASLALGLIIDTVLMYFRIINRSILYVTTSLFTLISSTSLNVYFIVFLDSGPIGIVYSSFISRLILLVPLTGWMLSQVGIRFRAGLAKEMLKFSLPLIPSELAHTIVGYSDRFFINHYVSTAAAGIYGIAMRLGTILHMLVTSPFITTFLPRRFEIARDKDAPNIFSTIFDVYSLLMLVLTTGICVFSYELVYIFTEQRFHNAADYIPIVSLGMVILGFKYHVQFGIYYKKKTVHSMFINLSSMVVHLACNAILVPRYGLWGAVAAFLIATTVNVLTYLIVAQRYYYIPYKVKRLILLVVLCLTTYLLSELVTLGNFWTGLAVKAVIYSLFVFSLFLTRLVNLDSIFSVIRARDDI